MAFQSAMNSARRSSSSLIWLKKSNSCCLMASLLAASQCGKHSLHSAFVPVKDSFVSSWWQTRQDFVS